MKNTKPIKRSKAFIQFSKDHHFGLLLAWKTRQDLAQKLNTREITRYILDFFDENLQQHFKEEEELIFTRLPAADPLRRQAEDEHRKIYEIIGTFRERDTDEKLLQEFADLLEAHIRFEERSLFNHLQEHMKPEELEALLISVSQTEGSRKKPILFSSH